MDYFRTEEGEGTSEPAEPFRRDKRGRRRHDQMSLPVVMEVIGIGGGARRATRPTAIYNAPNGNSGGYWGKTCDDCNMQMFDEFDKTWAPLAGGQSVFSLFPRPVLVPRPSSLGNTRAGNLHQIATITSLPSVFCPHPGAAGITKEQSRPPLKFSMTRLGRWPPLTQWVRVVSSPVGSVPRLEGGDSLILECRLQPPDGCLNGRLLRIHQRALHVSETKTLRDCRSLITTYIHTIRTPGLERAARRTLSSVKDLVQVGQRYAARGDLSSLSPVNIHPYLTCYPDDPYPPYYPAPPSLFFPLGSARLRLCVHYHKYPNNNNTHSLWPARNLGSCQQPIHTNAHSATKSSVRRPRFREHPRDALIVFDANRPSLTLASLSDRSSGRPSTQTVIPHLAAMVGQDEASSGPKPFEAFRNRTPPHARRARPPDVHLVSLPEDRVPLRADRMQKRESRLGLRNLFSRSKSSRESPQDVSSQMELNRPGGLRTSLVAITQQQQQQQQQQQPHTQTTRLKISSPMPVQTVPRPSHAAHNSSPQVHRSPGLMTLPSGVRAKMEPALAAKQPRGHIGTWDPPPLFKAYPQAVKYAHLPATVISADAILRQNDRKGSGGTWEDLTQSRRDQDGDQSGKRRHRRNTSESQSKLDWTSKVYLLCTSGYLLQYSGEGTYDRLPEKILQLGKDSAAFVSDAIPGRHWVLQVSSFMDANGPTQDSRSLFSKLPFRGFEKRQTSNLLLVFENVEDMEGWIAVLRREIEALGGKKSTSETGQPKREGDRIQLRLQPSQRTLVVRDPDRFSRVIPPDFSWRSEQEQVRDTGQDGDLDRNQDDADGSVVIVESEATPETAIDDASTTNSVVSHDGCQLDSLRHSANRLSCISSGQRTVFTSSSSSPPCSPIRDFFDVPCLEPPPLSMSTTPQLRPRPNAAAILDRRQSMQTMNLMDLGNGTYAPRLQAPSSQPPTRTSTPNFSVPISKRFSLVKSTSIEPSAPVTANSPQLEGSAPRPTRRAPPTTFSLARPLSIVADRPTTPMVANVEDGEGQATANSAMRAQPRADRPTSVNQGPQEDTFLLPVSASRPAHRKSLALENQHLAVLDAHLSPPRKASSMRNIRREDHQPAPIRPPEFQHLARTNLPSPPTLPHMSEEPRRCLSPRDGYAPNKSCPMHIDHFRGRKTSSVCIETSKLSSSLDRPIRYSMIHPSDIQNHSGFFSHNVPPREEHRQIRASSTAPICRMWRRQPEVDLELQAQTRLNRRSMPQLMEGPPPAPPPTCSLPPIPQKQRAL
ncbi:hypothetical protein SODALDRAFT_378921 [Sodiomyces alkalinus F11]|uniref:PH domain-containing protein n=1 Tax=Sodiomyces alkalinus (strain CBS 110278 / VKM F-3762 / F11) TaxID=1314773 RepID=A0A3N2PW87_SODAK|nr:hypothetical protein SODALDRAFT_378921 [Sodiomyces alkalinus F11]ROT38760.1 hypothetical protein SODALDRAFT_378921 [Sodiomyces alkalinus F11]